MPTTMMLFWLAVTVVTVLGTGASRSRYGDASPCDAGPAQFARLPTVNVGSGCAVSLYRMR